MSCEKDALQFSSQVDSGVKFWNLGAFVKRNIGKIFDDLFLFGVDLRCEIGSPVYCRGY